MQATTDDRDRTDRGVLDHDQVETVAGFFRDYYRDELGAFAQAYPDDQSVFPVSWRDLSRACPDIADDALVAYDRIRADLADALRRVDLPVGVEFEHAEIAIHDLPPHYTHYPGQFSPTDEAGHYRAIRGEVSKATDVYSKLVSAGFECQRCGTITQVPQTADDFQ